MSRKEDRCNTLWEVTQAIKGEWVTLDTETTDLDGEVIQWAVCAPDGTTLGQGFVKPTVPISEGARAIHGITDEMLTDAPTFDVTAPAIWQLIEGKTVIIYNASFDIYRICTSLCARDPFAEQEETQKRLHWLEYDLERHCAMEWFAVIYGMKHEYYRTYTWQKLETACSYFDIPQEHAHDAASDARATALLVQAIAKLAQQELPQGYHPPRDEECAGGCGRKLGPFMWNEDHTWYCLECGLTASYNRLCPRCESMGKRTIVTTSKVHQEPVCVLPGILCYECQYKVNLASGVWHLCRCTRIIHATMEAQPLCTWCERQEREWQEQQEKRKAKKRAYQRTYRARKKVTQGTIT